MLSIITILAKLKKLYSLIKPGIIIGNLFPLISGFFIAGGTSVILLIKIMLWTSLVVASACVFNNCIDKDIDKLMERTKNRVLPKEQLSVKTALIFGAIIGIFGIAGFYYTINQISTVIAIFGFFIYVIIYSIFMKRTSLYAIHIGGISGAVIPLIGYTSVANDIQLNGILLFIMLMIWQIPHSFAIEIFRFNDYNNTSIVTLPIKKGLKITKIHMLFYILIFTFINILMFILQYTGLVHLCASTLFNLYWIFIMLQGFKLDNNILDIHNRWARKSFFCSIISLMSISIAIIIDSIFKL